MTKNLKPEIEANFGVNLTPLQLWTLVKLAKHVRLRCRNNAAFNNYFNSLFPYASFRQVQKQRADGTSYPGLQIVINGQTIDSEEDSE